MNKAITISNEYELYKLASFDASQAYTAHGDDGYGCGTSFVTIKGNTAFYRWAKKQGLVSRDAYYGFILDTTSLMDKKPSATLAEEAFNRAFAATLSANGVHAFNHTLLS